MSIRSQLEEAARCLADAKNKALTVHDLDLGNAISMSINHCRKAIELAEPSTEWRREVCALWDAKGIKITVIEFAALIAYRELEKYAKRMQIESCDTSDLWKQITALESVAKGGGE